MLELGITYLGLLVSLMRRIKDWPGRIPVQLVDHILYYFTQEGDLVFDPMAGGGVVADTCLAFNRKCWSFDLVDRPETSPEIEPHQWNPETLIWPVKGKEKPALIFFDLPYFNKLADQYTKDSISSLSRKEYLGFFREFSPLAREHSKNKARIAFLNADWPPATPRREATQRFQANIVAQMQKNRTLGIVRRSLIIGRKK